MFEQITIQENKNIEYGLVDLDNRTAIIPDHYVIWIYKIVVKGRKNNRKYIATKIQGLYTYIEYNSIYGV